jgi:hypothetical protein
MIEPVSVTVGSLAALALSKAVEAIAKGVAEEATKDAYRAFKEKLSGVAPSELDAFEKKPDSPARQAVIAEIIDAQPQGEKEALRFLAEALASAMNKRLSPEDFGIQILKQWKAAFFKREPMSFVITFAQLNDSHRIEYSTRNRKIELDGTEIGRGGQWGQASLHFTCGENYDNFHLRFEVSGWTGKISNIELWANNKLILRSS